MEEDNNDLKGRLERLAGRGSPRGADHVLEAAQASATARPITTIRRFTPALAVAAAVSLIAGVAGAIAINRDDPPTNFAANPLGTVPRTTEAPVPEVNISARLIGESRLVPFNTCGAVTNYMRAQALRTVSAYGLPSFGGGMGGDVMFARESATAAPAAGAAEDSSSAQRSSAPLAATGGDEYSTTNVQEAGIDEPDVVKTDGKRIYALNGDKLFVLDPDGPKILGSITVGYANQLFLVGNRVMVFSVPQNVAARDTATSDSASSSSGAAMIAPERYRPQVRIAVIDVSNPESPKETSHLEVDGGYVSARLVDGVARVVLASYPSAMPFVYPSSDSPEARQAALENNRKVVRDAKFDDWVPGLSVTTDGKTTERPAVTCADAYHPPEFSGFGMLSVLSVDPANAAAAKAASVVADGQIVYASASRLYVATNQWGDVRPMAEGNMPMVQPVPKTLIHQFDISDPTVAKYLVSGSVRGTMLNQFSMSEHAGVLRVATTENNESFVTTLANQADKVLAQVGQVGGLGKNERIYAVRFIGPVGYVVTFRQVDPLYVIDLRDPAKPRVTGELKITGYSAYLHPVSDTLLIGVGQDATEEGRRLGTQVSLFDVSNPAAPKLVQKHALGQGDSPAEFDHHAFLYWAPKKLTVIPIQQYNANSGTPAFMGAVGLFTAPSEIREVGRVSHDNNNLIQRSLVIGSRLFTYSNGGIKASSIDNLAEQGWAPFPNAPQYQKGDPGGGGGTEPAPPPDRGVVEPQPAS